LDQSSVSHFIHKMGNHFQLLILLLSPLKKMLPDSREIELLQQTVEKASELAQSFSDYAQGLNSLSQLDLYEILAQTINKYEPSAAERGVVLHVAMSESVHGVKTEGDAVLLESAISGVIQNALEATHAGGQITVSATIEGMEGNKSSVVKIRVEDTGCGIQRGDLEKVSVPFYTTKKNHDGLGLSMASRFIELHGGGLQIESCQGKGTEINVTLPVSVQT